MIFMMKITRAEVVKLIGLGLLLGGAGLIPGFSSGTLAFVTGLFTLLIGTFSDVFKHPTSLTSWLKFGILITTMAVGAYGVSIPLDYVLGAFEGPLMWMFTGFILASIIPIQHEIKTISDSLETLQLARFLTIVTVISLATAIVSLNRTQDTFPVYTGPSVFFLSAFLASLAGLLPGISGSVVWIGMGQYTRYITAINQLIWVDLIMFGIATVLGYIIFARLIETFIQKRPVIAYAVLLGFTLSSVLWVAHIDWRWTVIEWGFNVVGPFTIGYGALFMLYAHILPLERSTQ